MEAKIQVGICDVSAVPNILHVPRFAIEGIANPAELFCQRAKFAIFVGGFLVRHPSDEQQAVLDDLFNGTKQTRLCFQRIVWNEEIGCSLDLFGIPADGIKVLVELMKLG